MVPEAPLEDTGFGLTPAGEGWFVLNARDAHWRHCEGRGEQLRFSGEADFPQINSRLIVLGPGEPIGNYHWENDQEDFLVLSGEALLIVEGQERPLRQWDLVHCPVGTAHAFVGAGDGCVIFTVGSRTHQNTPDWGSYPVDEAALRHGAGVEEETTDSDAAYARFPDPVPMRYRDGMLPDR